MEQLINTFGIDWKILIVQIVNFGILLGILSYVLYRPLVNLIESRRAQIIKGVADAERAESALRDVDSKKTDILANASLEAEKIVATARETGKVKEAELLKEGQQKYERMLVEASMKSEEIKRSALEESREEISRLIVLGIEKTLRNSK
ncbi:TPA: ATP synthase F0 subunit B [Patescibacteria group bacterium]|nr:MAG: ATP synthase subunit b [Parcubacteria group bacterium GW2011_GWD2_42_14]HCC05209.1 ATP synthase F0 subunit B [Patescibacteria group bacterium]